MAGASRGLRCLARGASSFSRNSQIGHRARSSVHPQSARQLSTSVGCRARQDVDAQAEAAAENERLLAKIKDEQIRSFAVDADAGGTNTVDAESMFTELPERRRPKPERESRGFFSMDEEVEDPDGDGEFETDDISSNAHLELEQVRELRQFSRLTSWDMPLLWQHRKEFNPPTAATPLKFRYTTYMGDTHPGARKVVMSFHVPSLPDLTTQQRQKLIKLLGARYNPSTEEAKMGADRYPTAAQNKRSLGDLLGKILKEVKEGKDTFEDIPMDFRHYRPKKKRFAFPEEWKMTEDRRKYLEDVRAQRLQIEQQHEQLGSDVDGVRLISEATASARSALREAMHVPAGGKKVQMLKR